MAQKTFTVDNVTLSTSWTYTADNEDDAGTRYDLTSKPSSKTADRTFTISGIDISTITSITLTWTPTATSSGSVAKPTAFGYGYAKVYPGSQNSSGGVNASSCSLTGLTSYISGSTVTCRFRCDLSSFPVTVYNDTKYGVGNCTGTVTFKDIALTVNYGDTSSSGDDEGTGLWIGVDGKARRAKDIWIGVNGVARRVKKAWIGVAGTAKLFYNRFLKGTWTGPAYNNRVYQRNYYIELSGAALGDDDSSGTYYYEVNVPIYKKDSTSYSAQVYLGELNAAGDGLQTTLITFDEQDTVKTDIYTFKKSSNIWLGNNSKIGLRIKIEDANNMCVNRDIEFTMTCANYEW